MTAQKLNVVIVGCGNIAGGFDAERPQDSLPYTHAAAYNQHGGFNLIACFDPNDHQRKAFRERWNVRSAFSRIDEPKFSPGAVDIVSICSPTALHREHIEVALSWGPKIIFCEKPITPSLAETLQCVQRCDENKVMLAINHTRRWAPDVVRFSDELIQGKWGKMRSAIGHYNKGVLNNGGHMLDLLIFLFGPLFLKTVGAPVWDYWESDPTISAVLHTENGTPIYLNTADARDYSFFELQIVMEYGVISLENGGLNWRIRRATDSSEFKGYRALSDGEIVDGEYRFAMTNAIKNIYNTVLGQEVLASTGHSAIMAQRLCEEIRNTSLAKC